MGSEPRLRPLDAVLIATLVGAGGAGACGGLLGEDASHREVGGEQCVTCHRDEYLATSKPPHPGTFPETCADCHTQTAWVPAKFTHPWPLLGAHAQAGCAACHGDPPEYTGIPTDCVGCHKDDYDASPYPGHQAFPLTCADCHNTLAWKPASTVAHPFALTGAHATIPCEACHLGNPPVYQGTPKDCVGCHQDDYDASPYPGHQTFSTACEQCHTTNAWKPATGGQHPEAAFPITSGPHAKYDCTECHNASLGAIGKGNADCVGCHDGNHTRAKMDPKHAEANGYPSGAAPANFCLDCHPKGKK